MCKQVCVYMSIYKYGPSLYLYYIWVNCKTFVSLTFVVALSQEIKKTELFMSWAQVPDSLPRFDEIHII